MPTEIHTTSIRPGAVVTFRDLPGSATTAFANIAQLSQETGLPPDVLAIITSDLFDDLTSFYVRRAGGEFR